MKNCLTKFRIRKIWIFRIFEKRLAQGPCGGAKSEIMIWGCFPLKNLEKIRFFIDFPWKFKQKPWISCQNLVRTAYMLTEGAVAPLWRAVPKDTFLKNKHICISKISSHYKFYVSSLKFQYQGLVKKNDFYC